MMVEKAGNRISIWFTQKTRSRPVIAKTVNCMTRLPSQIVPIGLGNLAIFCGFDSNFCGFDSNFGQFDTKKDAYQPLFGWLAGQFHRF